MCYVLFFVFSLARTGKTIVFSIHQPRYSIYKQFEFMILLSRGEIVYQGPAADTLAYFDALGKTEYFSAHLFAVQIVFNANPEQYKHCLLGKEEK